MASNSRTHTPPVFLSAHSSIPSVSTGNVPAFMCHAPQRVSPKACFIPIPGLQDSCLSGSRAHRGRVDETARPVGIRIVRTPASPSSPSAHQGHHTPTRSTMCSSPSFGTLSRLPTLTLPSPDDEEDECAAIIRRHQHAAQIFLRRQMPSPLAPFLSSQRSPSPPALRPPRIVSGGLADAAAATWLDSNSRKRRRSPH